MVQIKTGPDKTNKTTADLNENLQRLNTNIETLLKKREEAKAKADKDQEDKDKPKLLKELAKALKGNEASKQYGNGLNLAVAGLTGAAFPLVAKLNIDKMIGTTLKYAKDYVKKKWAESAAGQSSGSSKINSAVESNKQSGTHRRLDKITGLLQYIANKPKEGEEGEKKQSFFGRVLTFLGSLLGGILNSGIVKIVGALGALAAIQSILEKIAEKLNIKLTTKDKTLVASGVMTGASKATKPALQNILSALKDNHTNIKLKNKAVNAEMNWNETTKAAGFTNAEKAQAISSPKKLKAIAEKKGLTPKQIQTLEEASTSLKNTTAEIKATFSGEKAAKIGSWANKKSKSGIKNWFGRRQPGTKINQGILAAEGGAVAALSPILKYLGYGGYLLNIGAHGWEALTAPNPEETREAIMGLVGSLAMGELGGAVGAGSGLAIASLTGLSALAAPLAIAGALVLGGIGAWKGDKLGRMATRRDVGLPLNMNLSDWNAIQGLQLTHEPLLSDLNLNSLPNEYGIDSDSQYILDEDNKRDLTNLTSNTNTTNRLLTSIDESLQTILNAIGYQFQNRDNPSNPYNKSRSSSNPSRDQTVDILTPNKPDTSALWSN